jgi:hypothetical protein
MIYTAPKVMFLMSAADPLRGQVRGGLVPGNREFLGPPVAVLEF